MSNARVNYIAEFLAKNFQANIPDKSPSVKLGEIEEFVQRFAKDNGVDWEPLDSNIEDRCEHLENGILKRAGEVGAPYTSFRDFQAEEQRKAELAAAEAQRKPATLEDLEKRITKLEETVAGLVAFAKQKGYRG